MRPLQCLLILLIVLLPAGPFATTFPVTKTADTDDGICDPDCSLREAIDAANSNPGWDDFTPKTNREGISCGGFPGERSGSIGYPGARDLLSALT